MFSNILQPLGFKVLRPYSYVGSAGGVPIATSKMVDIQIGTSDFCVTDLWVFAKGAGGAEGYDFRIRNRTRNQDFHNRISPVDSGTANVSHIPYQTRSGQQSIFGLPWVVNAGDVIECVCYARYVAVDEFTVVLQGFNLDTVGKESPYVPYWYHFNGAVDDLGAGIDGVQQELVIAGSSDFYCYCIASCWDQDAVNVDLMETIRNESTGKGLTSKVARDGRVFMAPNNERYESAYPVPFVIPNNSVLTRRISNLGSASARRPECTLFGYFDKRKSV
jgi:hypothetical protein